MLILIAFLHYVQALKHSAVKTKKIIEKMRKKIVLVK